MPNLREIALSAVHFAGVDSNYTAAVIRDIRELGLIPPSVQGRHARQATPADAAALVVGIVAARVPARAGEAVAERPRLVTFLTERLERACATGTTGIAHLQVSRTVPKAVVTMRDDANDLDDSKITIDDSDGDSVPDWTLQVWATLGGAALDQLAAELTEDDTATWPDSPDRDTRNDSVTRVRRRRDGTIEQLD